jgi:endonuclease/exonuclease/phosphatase family metal-dependent hydrolase
MRVLILALLLLLPGLAPGRATGAELKLASWNIAWLTTRTALLPRDRRPRERGDLARLAEYGRRLDADIIALQEVDGPEAAALLLDPKAYAFHFPEEEDLQRSGFAIRRGLRVIRNPDLAALDLNPEAHRSLRRGTDVTVEAGGARLRLLSLHLKAGCSSGRLEREEPDCEQLARQGEILAGWIAARRREGVAFTLLGDFNRSFEAPGEPLYRRLESAAPLTRVTAGTSNPCWAGPRGGRAFIDHILLGGPAREWLVPGSLRVLVYAEQGRDWRERLSDHCPLSIRLAVP